jgi:hypothetical protein
MRRQAGYSVVELLVASAILFAISGAVLNLLNDGLIGTPVLEESTDLQQRARIVAEALAGELRAAAAGTPTGPLSRYFAAVEPRRPADPVGHAAADVLTLRYVPSGGAHARLAQPLAPASPVVVLDIAGCPANTIACGFVANTTAIVFDTSGHASVVNVDAIGPGVLTISDTAGGRSVAYAAGCEIAEASQVTFFLDAAARQLRRIEAGGAFVVADNVTALAFDYMRSDMTPLPLSQLADGPFIGGGAAAFDADLLQVATVRATVRLETGVDAMRGANTALFSRPGTATGIRTIPDIIQRIDVAVRNRN